MANSFLRRRCCFVYGSGLLLTALTVTATSLRALTAAAARAQAYGDDGLSPQQLHNIIDALIGSGDFGNWGKILSPTDPSMFPLCPMTSASHHSPPTAFCPTPPRPMIRTRTPRSLGSTPIITRWA
ncbi:hypothetical protein CDL15_Pgr005988 [Punica granatum]|uniref:Uncharacterized protein n=1 Tax=Punica granatum TaxID=22663 RepID=A0A218VTL5_PUNGR|nr:hypothetical protein CDL15_Pgr005988 [Punica granatum]PKI72056.1 hypothetical protein CRG98_007551 [Punica granatum]